MKHALHFPRIGKTLLAAALVAMAGTAAADQSLLGKLGGIFGASGETKAAAASRTIEGDIDATKALAYLYGEVQHNGRNKSGGRTWDCSEWAPRSLPDIKDILGDPVFGGYGGEKAEACRVMGEKYREQGKEKYMLITMSAYLTGSGQELPEYLFGASIFVNEGGQWKLESHNDFSEISTGWGGFIPGNFGKGGMDKKPGLLFYHASHAHCSTHYLTAFMPYDRGVKNFGIGDKQQPVEGVVEYIITPYTDPCSPEDLDLRARYDENAQGGYPDIVLEYWDGEGAKLKGSSRWRFQNGEYKEVKTGKKAGKKGAKKRK